MSDVWTIGRVVKWATDDFRARGIETPRLEAELLLAHVLGTDRLRLILDAERPLSPDELSRYRELIKRRRAGEPVAYLRGEREFYGRPFKVDKRVLIPRPETEALVETALERTRHVSLSARVLDLCTGSGCVAITIAKERPTARVDGVDVSADAIAVARDNAARLGAVWNVRWLVGDLFAPLDPAKDRYDLVTANPPYIAEPEVATLAVDIRGFEPRLALTGGADGLDVVRRIVRDAPAWLAPGGVLAMELGSGQSPEVTKLLEAAGFESVRVARDYGGHDRVVSGSWPGSPGPGPRTTT